MGLWLFKEEPEHYNFADLERDGSTLWDGISNSLALKHLRSVAKGDRIFFYHTGKEKAVVGEMRAAANAKVDPSDPADVSIEVKPIKRLRRPVTLQEIKADKHLKAWELARLPRLSVMPVTEEQWKRVEELSQKDAD